MNTSSKPSLITSTETDNSDPLPFDTWRPAQGKGFYLLKRAFDFSASVLLIVLLVPLWLVIFILIKLDSPGPALFVNQATGFGGNEFPLLKFRSMHPVKPGRAESQDVYNNVRHGLPTFSQNGKPVYKTAFADQGRITRIGRWLRKTSLDELPQLWNIVRGEMSLVGPRPALPREVALYHPWQMRRFLAKPGLTGLYQVTARNHVTVEEMVRIDLEYIRDQSLWLDFQIICKTPLAMFKGL